MGLDCGFENTPHKLRVMKNNEAMVTKGKKKGLGSLKVSTNENHGQMVEHKVWKAMPPSTAPQRDPRELTQHGR
jgi:hypothetical protein